MCCIMGGGFIFASAKMEDPNKLGEHKVHSEMWLLLVHTNIQSYFSLTVKH
mgnify:CR=1 FL=1